MLHHTCVKRNSLHCVQRLLNYNTLDYVYLCRNSFTHFDGDVIERTASLTSYQLCESLGQPACMCVPQTHEPILPHSKYITDLPILSYYRLFPVQGSLIKIIFP
jgi:hypothetical protein